MDILSPNDNVNKYVHKSIHNVECRFKSINLFNLAQEMNVFEVKETIKLLHPLLIDKITERYNALVNISAPDIIIGNEKKILDKTILGKHSNMSPLNKKLKKLSVN